MSKRGPYRDNRGDERLWSKVDASGDCWEWLAGKKQGGYGRYSVKHKLVQAHRFIYEKLVGSLSSDLDLDHLCRNHSCVNPDHLEPVTRLENLRRGYHFRRGRLHCDRGHLFDEENTYIGPKGFRECKACRQIYDRRRRQKERSKHHE